MAGSQCLLILNIDSHAKTLRHTVLRFQLVGARILTLTCAWIPPRRCIQGRPACTTAVPASDARRQRWSSFPTWSSGSINYGYQQRLKIVDHAICLTADYVLQETSQRQQKAPLANARPLTVNGLASRYCASGCSHALFGNAACRCAGLRGGNTFNEKRGQCQQYVSRSVESLTP